MNKKNQQTTLHFTATNEVNVRYYSIEASNDNHSFDIIGRVAAKSNTLKSVKHSYNLAGHDYTYYRVTGINMDGSMPQSVAVSAPSTTPDKKEYKETMPVISTDGAVVNK